MKAHYELVNELSNVCDVIIKNDIAEDEEIKYFKTLKSLIQNNRLGTLELEELYNQVKEIEDFWNYVQLEKEDLTDNNFFEL